MILENSFLVLLALFLVLLNGFFVAAEFAMVKLRHTRVAELKANKGWRGGILYKVHTHLDAYLSACQLGITLASLGLGWVGEPAFATLLEPLLGSLGLTDPRLIHTLAFAVSFALISYLHIVIGELAPKSMAIREPEMVSLWTAVPLFLFYWTMYPFISVLNASANRLLRATGLSNGRHGHEAPYSHGELRAILHLSRAGGEQAGSESNSDVNSLLTHTLDLPSLEVSDIMHSRRELIALEPGMGHAEVQELLLRYRYSRYPLLNPETGEALGVYHFKDLYAEGAGPDFSQRMAKHLRPVVQVREDEPVMNLLKRFRQGAPQLAMVVDESALPIGFVTLEDVLEVVFGELADEHAVHRSGGSKRRIQRIDANNLRMPGNLPLYLLERTLGRDLQDEDGDIATVGGLITHHLGRMAQTDDIVELPGLMLRVERTTGPKVDWVKARYDDPAAEGDERNG